MRLPVGNLLPKLLVFRLHGGVVAALDASASSEQKRRE
jgi:hypothetical protein